MPPCSLQKTTKIVSKIDLGRHQFFDRFLHRFFIDFCSIWEANLAPCWPLFRSKWRYAVASAPLFSWVYVLFRFLAVLAPSWRHLGSIWVALGLDVGRFLRSILAGFGNEVGRFWIPFCKRMVTIWLLFWCPSCQQVSSFWKFFSIRLALR